MRKRVIPAGTRFGKLVLIERVGRAHASVVCDCGTTKTVWLSNLLRGKTGSCAKGLCHGHATHGHSVDRKPTHEFRTWSGIITRCHGAHADCRYVARGTVVCERWRESFAAFLADMGTPPSPTHTLDRVDNDGNYEPGNCRWATRKEQARNTSTTLYVEFAGQRLAFATACEELGVARHVIESRMRRWAVPFEEAVLRQPIVARPRKVAA